MLRDLKKFIAKSRVSVQEFFDQRSSIINTWQTGSSSSQYSILRRNGRFDTVPDSGSLIQSYIPKRWCKVRLHRYINFEQLSPTLQPLYNVSCRSTTTLIRYSISIIGDKEFRDRFIFVIFGNFEYSQFFLNKDSNL